MPSKMKPTLECEDCEFRVWYSPSGREEMDVHQGECPGESDPRERFDVGDRVQYSALGRLRLGRDRREGEVAGFSEQEHCVRVRWDGNKTAGRYAHVFIKHAEPDDA